MTMINSPAMTKLFDTHAHLISDDWDTYPPRPLQPGLPVPGRTDYTVTAEALIQMMDEQRVATACVVQRGHLSGYDNSYIIEAGRRFPDRLLPVVILDTKDPTTHATLTQQRGVRGVRMANTRPSQIDTEWMASPAALQVWQTCARLNLPVAIIFFQNQLPWTLPLLRQIALEHPALPILIDHLGIPWGALQRSPRRPRRRSLEAALRGQRFADAARARRSRMVAARVAACNRSTSDNPRYQSMSPSSTSSCASAALGFCAGSPMRLR
jgi:predicted TIM-barrel fold metal-dependent hydrolase